jgi:hypothetical protein
MARKYSKAASDKVERALHERKAGKLKSGRSGKTVKSRKQAIAIGLSEARKEGKKVPARRSASASRSSGSRKSSTSKSTGRKSTPRKSKARKSSGRKSASRSRSN